MHPNPIFHTANEEENLAFARARSFGILAVDGPLLAHVPFLLSDDGAYLDLHLVRSNPIARALNTGPLDAVIAVSGPDSYISPDWYEVDDQVPTWNYVAVHLRGALSLSDPAKLRDVIDAQTALFEARLHPKPAWHSGKMTKNVMDRMMRQIVPCRMQISAIDGTWKLNQNKPEDVRLRAADKVAQFGQGTELDQLAQMMRNAKLPKE